MATAALFLAFCTIGIRSLSSRCQCQLALCHGTSSTYVLTFIYCILYSVFSTKLVLCTSAHRQRTYDRGQAAALAAEARRPRREGRLYWRGRGENSCSWLETTRRGGKCAGSFGAASVLLHGAARDAAGQRESLCTEEGGIPPRDLANPPPPPAPSSTTNLKLARSVWIPSEACIPNSFCILMSILTTHFRRDVALSMAKRKADFKDWLFLRSIRRGRLSSTKKTFARIKKNPQPCSSSRRGSRVYF